MGIGCIIKRSYYQKFSDCSYFAKPVTNSLASGLIDNDLFAILSSLDYHLANPKSTLRKQCGN